MKLENIQPSGSFKSRGIGNYIVCRAAERVGFLTHFYAASRGNASIACVHAAKLLGYSATVVIPTCATPSIVAKVWSMGATAVIQPGAGIAEAQEHIQKTLLPEDPNGELYHLLITQTSGKEMPQLYEKSMSNSVASPTSLSAVLEAVAWWLNTRE